MGLGSRIRDPGSGKNLFRIRIRNTAIFFAEYIEDLELDPDPDQDPNKIFLVWISDPLTKLLCCNLPEEARWS